MRALVTGVAGFVGSNLADQLVGSGWHVRGIDRFTNYYEEAHKRSNLEHLLRSHAFELIEADLLSVELRPLLADIDVVFHLAAQPGVRLSWADGFPLYNELNVNVTQRLLEACRLRPPSRFVYASSSSVYGQAPAWPTEESAPTRPHSPYGVTKLAGEMLCSAYAVNFGVPTVSLRYFTVYGPRQRPDMATYRMLEAARRQTPFPLYGDGQQVRDFTYVGDVVDATVLASTRMLDPGVVINIAGGSSTRLIDLVRMAGSAAGMDVPVVWAPAQPGDVARTGGSIERAKELLCWEPRVSLDEGLARQMAWHVARLPAG